MRFFYFFKFPLHKRNIDSWSVTTKSIFDNKNDKRIICPSMYDEFSY